MVTSAQLKTWKNGETLFRHAIEVTRDNYIAYDSLAGALDEEGRHDEALPYYYDAVRIEPKYPEAQYNLGTTLKNMGRLDEAAEHLRAAIAANPKFAAAYVNLGATLMKQGKTSEAGGQFVEALKLDQSNPHGIFQHGHLAGGRRAVGGRRERLQPGDSVKAGLPGRARESRGYAHAIGPGRGGDHPFVRGGASEPHQFPGTLQPRPGLAWPESGPTKTVTRKLNEALELKPGQPVVQSTLAHGPGRNLTRTRRQFRHYREALRLQPDNRRSARTGWRGCLPPISIQNSGPAPKQWNWRPRLVISPNPSSPMLVETLAAAYAEAGRFPDAIAAAQKAISLTRPRPGRTTLRTKGRQMLKEFQAGKPYRTP